MQNQQIPVITTDYIVSLHTMLEQLTAKVDQIEAMLEGIAIPALSQIPRAPDRFEVSLSFFSAATGISKGTIERRIADKKLPMPQMNPYNRY